MPASQPASQPVCPSVPQRLSQLHSLWGGRGPFLGRPCRPQARQQQQQQRVDPFVAVSAGLLDTEDGKLRAAGSLQLGARIGMDGSRSPGRSGDPVAVRRVVGTWQFAQRGKLDASVAIVKTRPSFYYYYCYYWIFIFNFAVKGQTKETLLRQSRD